MRAALLVLVTVLLAPPAAHAATVTIALQLDYPLLTAALRTSLGASTGPILLWGESGGCQSLVLDDVAIAQDGPRVRITAAGSGEAGFDVAAFCFLPLSWHGQLVARGTPTVDDRWQLHLHHLRSELLDREGHSTFVARRLWSFVGDEVDERLAAFSLDVAPPVDAIRAVVRDTVPADRAAPVVRALDTLRVTDTVVDGEAVIVRLAMDVEDTTPAPPAPEPAVDADTRARWNAALSSWDGFLTFVVKDLGVRDEDAELRDGLFDLLVRSRRQLLDVLAAGPRPGEDPVRVLFVDAWSGLRRLVRREALAGRLGDHALRYVAFLAAGDALQALEAAAPGLGIDFSADGLRRLARTLDPTVVGDPVAASDAPDPQLRALFGFHEPEASPPGVGTPPPDADALEAEPETTATSTTSPPSDTTTTTLPPAAPAPDDGGGGAWWWPFGNTAWAAEPAAGRALADVGRALDRWLPAHEDLRRYRDLVSTLLDQVAADESARSGVQARFNGLYRPLVRATAWQESCWRQYVDRGGRAVPKRSPTGDVGIMQVNVRVWRGFFDVRKLEWDIVYNAGAGAEILAQLLARYGVKEADRRDGQPARACYAAYNGGPGAFARYRSGNASPRDRAVDAMFWDKFQTTAAGRELDEVLCEPL